MGVFVVGAVERLVLFRVKGVPTSAKPMLAGGSARFGGLPPPVTRQRARLCGLDRVFLRLLGGPLSGSSSCSACSPATGRSACDRVQKPERGCLLREDRER
jgi:hypothetical protein